MTRKRIVVAILVLVLVAAAAGLWLWTREGDAPAELVASGTVEATEARLGFQLPGRIEAVNVREGERVEAGTVLATLEAAELQARHRQALARLRSSEAMLRELTAGSRSEEIAQAEAAVAAADERLADARRDLERSRTLHRGGAISQEAAQKSATAADVAAAQLRQTREQLALVRRGPRQERIDAQRSQVEEAREAVRAAEAALAYARIVAPIAGVVTVRHHEPNEIVAAGQPVLTIMNPGDRWVRIYVPENRIGAVKLGTAASIASDTYPARRYPGRVTHVSPQAEFTPKAVQTKEERVRLVFAVKVAMEGDADMDLKPGMPADVTLSTDGE